MNNPNSELDPQNPMHRLAHQTAEELNQFHDDNREIAIESMEEEARVEDEVAYQREQDKRQNEIDIAEHEHYNAKRDPERFTEEPIDKMREMRNEDWSNNNVSDPYGD